MSATPGPWRLFPARTMAHLRAGDGFPVASLVFVSPEDKANARLIAASPTMYEALKPFAALCDEIEACAREDGSTPAQWAKSCTWEDLLAARAAIAKATGEANDPARERSRPAKRRDR